MVCWEFGCLTETRQKCRSQADRGCATANFPGSWLEVRVMKAEICMTQTWGTSQDITGRRRRMRIRYRKLFMDEWASFFKFIADAHVISSSISQSVRLWWGSAPWWRNRNPNQWLRFWRGSVSLSTSLWSFFQRRLYSMNRWRSGRCVTALFLSIPKVSDIIHFHTQSAWNLDVPYCLSIINAAFKTEMNYN